MTSENYLSWVIKQHALSDCLDTYTQFNVVNPLERIISDWAGNYLCDVKLSGSRAKGTAIDLSTDLDLFISLSSMTNKALKEIYISLYNYLVHSGIDARKQNVSIKIMYGGKKVDLVPAKRQGQFGNDHSLYKRKSDSWIKTNINTHISKVRNSGRRGEIIALKVWRENHNLEFPSIYLETFAIDALYGKPFNEKAENFLFLLQIIKDTITTRQIIDPANSNNILSNELTLYEKGLLAKQAECSLKERYWKDIIQ